MSFERVHEDLFGHFEPAVQGDELGVGGDEFVGGDGGEGAVEVVDAVEEVLGEALQGEVLGGFDFARGLRLQVAVVGYGAF